MVGLWIPSQVSGSLSLKTQNPRTAHTELSRTSGTVSRTNQLRTIDPQFSINLELNNVCLVCGVA